MNNEFKGTKENWYHDNGNSLSIFHPKALGVRLATVEKTSTIGKHDYDLSIKPTEEYKYNALLISKAPEMLEALQGVIKLRDLIDYDESIVNESNIGEASALNQILNRIQTLIQEATTLK